MQTTNIKLYLSLVLTILFTTTSCSNDAPMHLDNESDIKRIQTKIEKLAKGNQIDSISIRSTDRKSLVSSIFIVVTDSNNEIENKRAIEYLPQHKLTVDEKSKIKKDALHSFKVNFNTLSQYISSAKQMIPTGYSYKDIQGVSYNADTFGEKYYFGLEVKSSNSNEGNEYIQLYYDNQKAEYHNEDSNLEPKNIGEVKYVIAFRVENEELQMLKAN